MTDPELRQLALNLIQASDSSSVLELLKMLAKRIHALEQLENAGAPPLDVKKEFLRLRRKLLQRQLEDLEQTNPALAAQLQAVIDRYCTQSPFPY